MGNMHATEYAGMASAGEISLDTALLVHLQSNHYPPVHSVFVPVAREAIERANAGDWDFEQEYPNGLVRTVAYTVDGLHLHAFLDGDEE